MADITNFKRSRTGNPNYTVLHIVPVVMYPQGLDHLSSFEFRDPFAETLQRTFKSDAGVFISQQ